MAYTVPQMNLLCDVWNAGHVPDVDDPDSENVPCQLYLYSRGTFPVQPCELELYCPPIFLRLPIAENAVWVNGQVFEVPSESGNYYRARFKETMHRGFPNEYKVAFIVQCNGLGVPLIRDIEFAEPCNDDPEEGSGSVGLTYEITPTGEGELIAGGGGMLHIGNGDPEISEEWIGNGFGENNP